MEIILRQDVPDLGKAGAIVAVRDGYGRNYLIPRGLAYPATEGNKARVVGEAKRRGQIVAGHKNEAEALAQRLIAQDLTFPVRVGDGDKLFGSITAADIAGRLAELGVPVDKRLIELDEPIKTIGVYRVPVRLHPDVRPELRVWVVKET